MAVNVPTMPLPSVNKRSSFSGVMKRVMKLKTAFSFSDHKKKRADGSVTTWRSPNADENGDCPFNREIHSTPDLVHSDSAIGDEEYSCETTSSSNYSSHEEMLPAPTCFSSPDIRIRKESESDNVPNDTPSTAAFVSENDIRSNRITEIVPMYSQQSSVKKQRSLENLSHPTSAAFSEKKQPPRRKITFHQLLQFKSQTSPNSSPPSSTQTLPARRCGSLRVNPKKGDAWNMHQNDILKAISRCSSQSNNSRRIMVAVDGSENAERAFRWYLDYMMDITDRIVLVTIAEPRLAMSATLTPVRNCDAERDCAAHIRHSEHLLRRYMDRAKANSAHQRCEAHIYMSRRPADALVTAARMHQADVMVMGSRGDGAAGRGGLRGYFLGSVSRSVLKSSPVPVTLVPPYQVDPSGEETAQFHHRHRCKKQALAKMRLSSDSGTKALARGGSLKHSIKLNVPRK